MGRQEFLLLIPAIIYGVAIVDLLKVFRHRKHYWESLLWGIVMMMAVIVMWLELYRKLGALADSNLSFILIIVQAMVYGQIASVLATEDESLSGKEHFINKQKQFFLLLALSALVNLLVQFLVFEDNKELLRLVSIPILLSVAYLNKVWLRTVIAALIATWGINALFLS